MTTNNAINTGILASTSDVEAGTSGRLLVNPAAMQGYMSELDFTGFVSWAAGGPYFDVATLGTFKLLVGGTGFIKGKKITWVAQNFVGMTSGNTYYIYIDNTGTIGATPTRTDALFTDNIVLFECLRDATPVTNNQVVVKENHPYNYPATTANYEHDNIGTLIENNQGGANITLNGTQKIQINGADVLSDHGLETTIPDSGGVGVTWNKKYTTAAGKWALQNATDTFTGFWNNAGTPTALTANRHGVYTLYVSKDNLNSTTPVYFAVLDTSQYTSLAAANTAISNGTTAKSTNELQQLELCQLGYIIYSQAANAIESVIIAKATLKSSTSTAGANTASLINTNTAGFTGWLGAGDTTVQQSLNDLDQVLIGGTAGQVALSQGAGAKPLYKTPTSGTGTTVTTNATTLSWALNTPVAITDGGTNANSMSTSTGIVKYDGTSLVTSSTAKIDSSNRMTNTSQPAFLAYLSSTTNNVTGNGTVYTIGASGALTETFDQDSNFNTNGTFTAPITGKYFLSVAINMIGITNATSGGSQIVTSNMTYTLWQNNPKNVMNASSGVASFAHSGLFDMDAGDTFTSNISIFGEGSDACDVSGIVSSTTRTYMSGFLVC